MERINEATLSPDAQRALRLIRALRALPETSGTVGAEKRAINSLRLNDVAMVALVLQQDDEEADRGKN